MGHRASASEPRTPRARGRGPALASVTLVASRRQRSAARGCSHLSTLVSGAHLLWRAAFFQATGTHSSGSEGWLELEPTRGFNRRRLCRASVVLQLLRCYNPLP